MIGADGAAFLVACEEKRRVLGAERKIKAPTSMASPPPNPLPAGWTWGSLSSVCERVSVGHVGPTTEHFVSEGGVSFIRSQNVRPGLVILDECARITTTFHSTLKKSQLLPGDILIVRVGANRGDVGVVPRTNEPINCANIVFARPLFDGRFFAYYLRSPSGRVALLNLTTGAAQGVLNTEDVARLPVPVPPNAVQSRIASMLGAYDDLIEVNRRRIAVLEEMARRLFEEWFVHFRFPGHDSHQTDQTTKGNLPEDWTLTTLDALAAEVRDSVLPSEVAGDTPYVGLEHIPRRSTTLNDWGRVEDVTSTKLKFRRGDILFGKIRPYFHKVCWAPFEGVCSSDAIVIRPRSEDVAALVLALTSSDPFVAHSVQTSNGTKMPRANWNVLIKYPVPMPTCTVRQRFHETVIPGVELAATLQQANTRLAASRDLLLPRLISGELSVKAAERELEDAA